MFWFLMLGVVVISMVGFLFMLFLFDVVGLMEGVGLGMI